VQRSREVVASPNVEQMRSVPKYRNGRINSACNRTFILVSTVMNNKSMIEPKPLSSLPVAHYESQYEDECEETATC